MSATITTLASFGGGSGYQKTAGLIVDAAGNLYGTTPSGGANNDGTVFEVQAGSGVVTTLASFGLSPGDWENGAFPSGGLIADAAGNLYGTAADGISYGTVFELQAGSSVITTIVTFNGSNNGGHPRAGVIADAAGNLYGTTSEAGAYGDNGTVFEVQAGSGVVTTLANFDGSNGWNPVGGVIADAAGNLYGTTPLGGAGNVGTVFEVKAGSGVVTTLVSFDGSNGDQPTAGLIADAAGNLFGTTAEGGAGNNGTVFEVKAGSDVVTTLATFDNSNGSEPFAGLIVDAAGDLFGTTVKGGANGDGTVFEVKAGSGVVTVLASFDGNNGTQPYAGLVADAAGDLYGVTSQGGANGDGTVFELTNTGFVTASASCFLRGTRIATPAGEVAVEALRIGDPVLTASGEAVPIHWIGTRGYLARLMHPHQRADLLPIRIAAGALGEATPARDLFVSPEHMMCLDGVLVAARNLLNGTTIARAGNIEKIEYFHIELPRHSIILAEGAATESFLDTGNRNMFANVLDYLTLGADLEAPQQAACLPIVAEGTALDAIRGRLAERTNRRAVGGAMVRKLEDANNIGTLPRGGSASLPVFGSARRELVAG